MLAPAGLGFFIDDCFYAIAIWIENKRSKIVRAIFGVEACPAVVFPTVLKRCSMECCHSLLR